MNDSFFSVGGLLHDRKFIVSFVITGAIAVGGIVFAIDNIMNHKIAINPVAGIEFVSAPESSAPKPVSELVDAAAKGWGSSAKDVWFAYVVDLARLCANSSKSRGTTTAVIFKTDKGFTVGTAELDTRTCGFASKLKSSEAVYAASDTPFAALPSEKRFFSLDYRVPRSQ